MAWLRSALRNLYDGGRLEASPLIDVFGLRDDHDAPARLRRQLIEAVQSLEPDPDTPPDSHAWRAYETLLYRYVQRLSQVEVARQVGLSTRQLRREELRAVEDLAGHLEEQYGLAEGRESSQLFRQSTVDDELAWIDQRRPEDHVDLGEVLHAAIELLQPLARKVGIAVSMPASPSRWRVVADPGVLRQALVSVMTMVLKNAGSTSLDVEISSDAESVSVVIGADRDSAALSVPGDDQSLQLLQRLVGPYGGTVIVDTSGARFQATMSLPTPGEIPVLLIDDNHDTWRLLGRYLAHSHYRLYPVEALEAALLTAREVNPRIIVLDVMMPNADGWEILGNLTSHPDTTRIPVIVLTVLVEEELALSLGAKAFMRKPISRDDFLRVLDRTLYESRQESRETPPGNA